MRDRSSDRPEYDSFRRMDDVRGPLAHNFARQILDTTRPFLPAPPSELRVLDIGSGYGHTAIELARHCRRVVGIEPSATLWQAAQSLNAASGLTNVQFRRTGIYDFSEKSAYDLVVLDNVLEHLPDQPVALRIVSECLTPGGVAYILVPNRLWPVEAHYHLPFLTYLPLRLANLYLHLSGRGRDYTDASHAPTYCGLNRLLRDRKELSSRYVLPANLALTMAGNSLLYRMGVAMIRRCPWLWAISKSLLVIAVKRADTTRD